MSTKYLNKWLENSIYFPFKNIQKPSDTLRNNGVLIWMSCYLNYIPKTDEKVFYKSEKKVPTQTVSMFVYSYDLSQQNFNTEFLKWNNPPDIFGTIRYPF